MYQMPATPTLLAGGALGTMFFGGLWLTVRFALASANPGPWLIVSSMLRMAALLAALYLICRIDWVGLIAALAGFLMVMLRRVPKRTDTVTWGGFRFEVLDVDSYRIDQVMVSRSAAAADPAASPLPR